MKKWNSFEGIPEPDVLGVPVQERARRDGVVPLGIICFRCDAVAPNPRSFFGLRRRLAEFASASDSQIKASALSVPNARLARPSGQGKLRRGA